MYPNHHLLFYGDSFFNSQLLPQTETISQKTRKKISLTTAVKHQAEEFANGVWPLYPDPTPTNALKKPTTDDQKLRKRVEFKITDGDITGAVRLLSSKAVLAPFNEETVDALHEKHPSSPIDLQLPSSPDTSYHPLNVSTTYIEKAIRSFNSGSAAGPDKLSPQHLKELASKQTGEAGVRLLQALAALANVMLAGKVPQDILSVLYGANLVALSGGIRPIAVGNILRHLVAKSAVLLLGGEIGELLRPTQLGFGTPGGCEAAVHATRRYLSATEEMSPRILLKECV